MSALWAPLGSGGGADVQAGGRWLRVVPRVPTRLARLPFVLVLIAFFGAGMAGLLMLNTTLQNQAFQFRILNRQATVLAYDQAVLQAQIDQLRAPPELARHASALGMRPNPRPAFLVVPGGKVVGKAKPVSGNESPDLIVRTPAELAAQQAAAEAKKRAAAAAKAAEEQRSGAAAEVAERAAAEQAQRRATRGGAGEPDSTDQGIR
jgi:hypothetical protein